jgi:hypothetical protein
MAETNYRELERKRTLQHYLTILARHWNGESINEIAKSLKMEGQSVQRDLEFIQKTYGATPKTPEVAGVDQWRIETSCDPMAKTSCSRCDGTIQAGGNRVFLMAVEMGSDGRGRSFSGSYCDSCIAEMPALELPNWWRLQMDAGATPSAGPAEEDVHGTFRKNGEAILGRHRLRRATSVQEIAQEKAASTDGQGDGDATNEADLEANVLSTDRPSRPGPEPAGEAAQRARLMTFLNNPKSRGMRSDMRAVARMWAEGASQSEVARKHGKDQSTVSRMIAGARKLAYAQG